MVCFEGFRSAVCGWGLRVVSEDGVGIVVRTVHCNASAAMPCYAGPPSTGQQETE